MVKQRNESFKLTQESYEDRKCRIDLRPLASALIVLSIILSFDCFSYSLEILWHLFIVFLVFLFYFLLVDPVHEKGVAVAVELLKSKRQN